MPEPASPQVKTPELIGFSPRPAKFLTGDRVVVLEPNGYNSMDPYTPIAGMCGFVMSDENRDLVGVRLVARAVGEAAEGDIHWMGIWHFYTHELEHCD